MLVYWRVLTFFDHFCGAKPAPPNFASPRDPPGVVDVCFAGGESMGRNQKSAVHGG